MLGLLTMVRVEVTTRYPQPMQRSIYGSIQISYVTGRIWPAAMHAAHATPIIVEKSQPITSYTLIGIACDAWTDTPSNV